MLASVGQSASRSSVGASEPRVRQEAGSGSSAPQPVYRSYASCADDDPAVSRTVPPLCALVYIRTQCPDDSEMRSPAFSTWRSKTASQLGHPARGCCRTSSCWRPAPCTACGRAPRGRRAATAAARAPSAIPAPPPPSQSSEHPATRRGAPWTMRLAPTGAPRRWGRRWWTASTRRTTKFVPRDWSSGRTPRMR